MRRTSKIDKQYQQLLQAIIDYGVEKRDRTGTGTKSIFGYTIRHKMSDGFPLLTTKKMSWKSIVTELLWFLRGDTNIKYLVDNGCNIWNGDAYKNYLKSYFNPENALKENQFIEKIKTDDEFAKKWGELGPIYGKQWRLWNTNSVSIDQIQDLIGELKTNPDSRRLMVLAWNVGELHEMVLPPCHYGFQVYTRELSAIERAKLAGGGSDKLHRLIKDGNYTTIDADMEIHKLCDIMGTPKRAISLMWNQRSVDTFLGLPFNIASYGLLLEIIAKEVNMVPDELIGNLGDTHLYLNHIEQAKEQIGRKYTPEERTEMLKEAMGYEAYHKAVQDLMPFGGGLSEYYDFHEIPHYTREPFELPTLKIEDEVKWREGDCLPSYSITDFTLKNYQSHPAIKAPLSN